MCGLVAFHGKNGAKVEHSVWGNVHYVYSNMLDSLGNRGPDESSSIFVKSAFLGHTRLSIIDINTGSQPIFNEEKNIAVLLNGEIYNFQELKSELISKGHIFKSSTDTEVIVHLYEECGEDVFSRLNGMFAIVIYDLRTDIFYAARDRAGEKPLLYWESDDLFAVASEIKTLLEFPGVSREIEEKSLALYLNSMYVPSPLTIFKNIRKLQPAHYIKSSNGMVSIHNYWQPEHVINWDWTEKFVCDQLVELFEDAVKIRMYSDVPLGVFLSGGIDSSAVTAFMARNYAQPVKTFTVGFAQEIDERPFARMVADKYHTEHTEIFIDKRVDEVFNRVIEYFDEPFGDSSAIPTYLVSQEARKHVKVILTGDGGDELFAGYGAYLNQKYQTGNKIKTKLYKVLNQQSLKYCGVGLFENSYPRQVPRGKTFAHWHWVRTLFSDHDLEKLFPGNMSKSYVFFKNNQWLKVDGEDALSISYAFDLNYYLPDDLLKKVDMASMLCSLECRAPFLDHRLIEFSLRIPPQMKVRNDVLKYLLKKSLLNYLPSEVLYRNKTGFGAPVESWLRTHLKPMVMDLLASSEGKVTAFIPYKAVRGVVEAFYCSSHHDDYRVAYKVWLLLVLETWMRKYL